METEMFSNLCRFIESSNTGDLDLPLDMQIVRLGTFHGINVSSSCIRLASAGFYATGDCDETQCYSCNVRHRGWRYTDNPWRIHRQLSPQCQHVVKSALHLTDNDSRSSLAPVSIQKISYERSNSYRSSNSHHRVVSQLNSVSRSAGPVVGSDGTTRSTTNTFRPTTNTDSFSPHPQLQFESAVHPMFSKREDRVKSFATWPLGHCKKPEELAAAGFFFVGYGDCVRCFYCGVGLKNWEEGDDQWLEHVRWRSSCSYLTSVKGQDFVLNTLAAVERRRRTSSSETLNAVQRLPPSENADILTTAGCQKALEMGFDATQVKQLAERLIHESKVIDAENLIECLLGDEDSSSNSSRLSTGNTPPRSPVTENNDLNHRSRPMEVESERRGELYTTSTGDWMHRSRVQRPGDQQRHFPPRVEITAARPCENQGSRSLTSAPSVQGKDNIRVPGHRSLPTNLEVAEVNRQLKESSVCKICLDDQANIVFLPCGHLVSCATCSPALNRCPLCRQHVRGSVRVYLANNADMKK